MKNLETRRSVKNKLSLILSAAVFMVLISFSLEAQIQLDVDGDAILRNGTPEIMLFDNGSGEERIESRWYEVNDNIFLESLRGHLLFATGENGTALNRMIITTGGIVGIGTTSPIAQLDVVSKNATQNAFSSKCLNFAGGGDGRSAVYAESNVDPGYGTGVEAIGGLFGVQALSNGVAGSGTTSGLRYGIHSNAEDGSFANYGILCDVGTSGSFNYAGQFNGDVHVTGTFTNPSDAKLKERVTEIDNMLSQVNALDVKSYEYKQSYIEKMRLPTVEQVGFIAQELQRVFPHLVHNQLYTNVQVKGDTEEYLGINYIGLIPILTKSVQELSDSNDSLERRIEALEALVLHGSGK